MLFISINYGVLTNTEVKFLLLPRCFKVTFVKIIQRKKVETGFPKFINKRTFKLHNLNN